MKVRLMTVENECLITEYIDEITLLSVDEETDTTYKSYYYEIECKNLSDIQLIMQNGKLVTPRNTVNKGDFILVMNWKSCKPFKS